MNRWWVAVVFMVILFGWQQWPNGKLRVVFCDVGQGDSSVVVLGSFQAVVDTGAYDSRVVECLSRSMPFWDRKIEVVFISHKDKDHSGALNGIKRRYKVGMVVDHPKIGDVIRYIDLRFDILKGSEIVSTVGEQEVESNQTSVVMRLGYRNFSVLYTGDIDAKTELALDERGLLTKSDVLKVAHHGSKYSSSQEFLGVVRPKLAVISVGKKNNYGHPSREVLSRLDLVGVKILRTDILGTVRLETDGKELKVFTEREVP